MLSLPPTLIGYWQSGSELFLSPVLLGGILAGYLAGSATGASHGIRYRAGAIGSLPGLLFLIDTAGCKSVKNSGAPERRIS